MIYQKDWLMRQIESIISAILNFLVCSSSENTFSDSLLSGKIDGFLERGDICDGENWIYENLDDQNIQWLSVSIYFYKRLNEYSDEYLEAHNFSRDEILSGLLDMSSKFGFEGLL